MDIRNRCIRFDWAIKRQLRDKANFGILEGFLAVLLGNKVHVVDIFECKGNQQNGYNNFNRTGIKVLDWDDEMSIVEIQITRELHYLECILYEVTHAITEPIELESIYADVKKIYLINILYFDIGKGNDYLYHGQNSFVGVHTGDFLQLTAKEKNVIVRRFPPGILSEYFLIRLNKFDKKTVTPLEEWVDYLKNGYVRLDTKALGLKEARLKLFYYDMNAAEREAYDRHVDAIMIQNDVLSTAKLEGLLEAKAEREKGKALDIARKLKLKGMSIADIMELTGITREDIDML